MVAAHMDEVGLYACAPYNKNKTIQNVVPLGGWNPYVVSAQRFTLQNSFKGDYPCSFVHLLPPSSF